MAENSTPKEESEFTKSKDERGRELPACPIEAAILLPGSTTWLRRETGPPTSLSETCGFATGTETLTPATFLNERDPYKLEQSEKALVTLPMKRRAGRPPMNPADRRMRVTVSLRREGDAEWSRFAKSAGCSKGGLVEWLVMSPTSEAAVCRKHVLKLARFLTVPE